MTSSSLPDNFIQTTIDLFGAQGKNWLDLLPGFLAMHEKRWNARLLTPFKLSYNYVAPGILANGIEVVFKAWLVNPELLSEIESLRLWNGRGIVQLLEADPMNGSMLLERLRPGVPLAETSDDDKATQIAAEVMQQLWIPAPPDPQGILRTVAGWARGINRLRCEFSGGVGPFPLRLVEAAETAFVELLSDTGPMRLLHGDLHHWNILSAQREPWLAIDPKGVIGEAEYETGAFLRNLWPEQVSEQELEQFCLRRINIFCDILGFDHQRVAAWAMAQAVLSAWWSYEDHHKVDQKTLFLAQAFLNLLD